MSCTSAGSRECTSGGKTATCRWTGSRTTAIKATWVERWWKRTGGTTLGSRTGRGRTSSWPPPPSSSLLRVCSTSSPLEPGHHCVMCWWTLDIFGPERRRHMCAHILAKHWSCNYMSEVVMWIWCNMMCVMCLLSYLSQLLAFNICGMCLYIHVIISVSIPVIIPVYTVLNRKIGLNRKNWFKFHSIRFLAKRIKIFKIWTN